MKNNPIIGSFASRVDVGRVRLSNEDRAFAAVNAYGDVLLLICDGMGGQNKGDYAAEIALKTVSEAFLNHKRFLTSTGLLYWIKYIVVKANKEIYKESNTSLAYQGMGTTLSMVVIHKNIIMTAQVGDSRIYFLENTRLKQISEDQTYVAYLYRTGQISKAEMKTHPKRHVLMNALGVYPSANVDTNMHFYNNQTILVCSDGVYNNVNDKTLENILKNDDNTEQKVTEIISIGNDNGGSDNMGIVLWEGKK